MIDYKANFNTNGTDFPGTAAINVSTPGASDGTELKALMVNDLWGARQAIMNYAGLTPNAASESYSNSQFLTALKNAFSPVGSIIMSHAQSDPATLGLRMIEMVGQTVLRANYADLDAVVYVGDAKNPTYPAYYHCNNSDGSGRSTTGIYLVIPDMRGAFIRGYDPTAVLDPDGVSRKFVEFQEEGISEHGQNVVATGGTPYRAVADILVTSEVIGTLAFRALPADIDPYLTAGAIYAYSGSTDETRPVNYNVKYWLRY